MRTSFIDYSKHFYETVAAEPLPPVRSGKFVQLWRGDAEEHIVVAPRELAFFHANIVQRFLDEHQVDGTYNAKRDVYHHRDQSWTVLGGGHFELDDHARTLRLYSKSLAYGSFERPGLAARLATCPTLTGYHITVE